VDGGGRCPTHTGYGYRGWWWAVPTLRDVGCNGHDPRYGGWGGRRPPSRTIKPTTYCAGSTVIVGWAPPTNEPCNRQHIICDEHHRPIVGWAGSAVWRISWMVVGGAHPTGRDVGCNGHDPRYAQRPRLDSTFYFRSTTPSTVVSSLLTATPSMTWVVLPPLDTTT
jgi:hypothetical protein